MRLPAQWPLNGLVYFMTAARRSKRRRHYFHIRIWSAPFALANYAFLGWFIGLGRTRTALYLQGVLNGVNVILNVAFVTWLGWGVQGVAIGTLIAEILAAGLGAVIAGRELARRAAAVDWERAFDGSGLTRMLAINSDLMIRTLCLLRLTYSQLSPPKWCDVILAATAVCCSYEHLLLYARRLRRRTKC